MFSKSLVDSDLFLDMPLTAQGLYFHLAMRADDDGFVNNPRKIQRMIGASDDDAKILAAKRFILLFPSGVVAVRHWKISNYIPKDRYKETMYADEKAALTLDKNNVYELADTSYTTCMQPVYNVGDTLYTTCIQPPCDADTQGREEKNRVDKVREAEVRKTPPPPPSSPPTDAEVSEYIRSRGGRIDARKFCDYYGGRGWKQPNGQPLDWKQSVERWENTEYPGKGGAGSEPEETANTRGFAGGSFTTDNFFESAVSGVYGDLETED